MINAESSLFSAVVTDSARHFRSDLAYHVDLDWVEIRVSTPGNAPVPLRTPYLPREKPVIAGMLVGCAVAIALYLSGNPEYIAGGESGNVNKTTSDPCSKHQCLISHRQFNSDYDRVNHDTVI